MKAGHLQVLELEPQISGIYLYQEASERDVDPPPCSKLRDFLSNVLCFIISSTACVQVCGDLSEKDA